MAGALGVGSGLDLEGLVQQLVQAESTPKIDLYNEKKASLNVTLSAYDAIESAVKDFQTSVKKLADVDSFGQRTTSITQPDSGDIISVTPSSSATPGNFDISVQALAQGSRHESSTDFTSTSQVVSASGGNLTFTVGSQNFSIAVDAGATVADIRNAINSSSDNFGISANLINTGSETKLVYTSNVTGSGNDLVVSNDNAELDLVSTTGASPNMTRTQLAGNASITIDGIPNITSSTNTFTDAIQDVTIKAEAVSGSGGTDQARLRIFEDTAATRSVLDEFVASYNTMVGLINEATGMASNGVGNILNGDAVMRTFEQQLFNTLSSTTSGAGNLTSVYDAGIKVGEQGKLEIRNSGPGNINDALENEFDSLKALFTDETNGIGVKLDEFLDTYLEGSTGSGGTTVKGIFDAEQENLKDRITKLDSDHQAFLERIDSYEATLRKQYGALDSTLASLRAQQSYLTQQLANISFSTNNN